MTHGHETYSVWSAVNHSNISVRWHILTILIMVISLKCTEIYNHKAVQQEPTKHSDSEKDQICGYQRRGYVGGTAWGQSKGTHFSKNSFIYFNWRLITLQYCGGFCLTSTWISHGYTRVSPSWTPQSVPYIWKDTILVITANQGYNVQHDKYN